MNSRKWRVSPGRAQVSCAGAVSAPFPEAPASEMSRGFRGRIVRRASCSRAMPAVPGATAGRPARPAERARLERGDAGATGSKCDSGSGLRHLPMWHARTAAGLDDWCGVFAPEGCGRGVVAAPRAGIVNLPNTRRGRAPRPPVVQHRARMPVVGGRPTRPVVPFGSKPLRCSDFSSFGPKAVP